ncbi:hypothetical protein ACIQOF_35740 [Streptomyces sp. NPDC091265]|uniref:hypothetical protein n=1 Tax=unclassified Streptomyces TaxID=2593676 RepID=UPI0034508C06
MNSSARGLTTSGARCRSHPAEPTRLERATTVCRARGTDEVAPAVPVAPTSAATSVELTINEALHARNENNTVDLYLVSDIRVDTRTAPHVSSEGTLSRTSTGNRPNEDLRPRLYQYRLPETTG